jgi:hypothetical protein
MAVTNIMTQLSFRPFAGIVAACFDAEEAIGIDAAIPTALAERNRSFGKPEEDGCHKTIVMIVPNGHRELCGKLSTRYPVNDK